MTNAVAATVRLKADTTYVIDGRTILDGRTTIDGRT